MNNVYIFQGEIARARGGIIGNMDEFGDTILFTTDDHILEEISKNDNSFHLVSGKINNKMEQEFLERPPTATVDEVYMKE